MTPPEGDGRALDGFALCAIDGVRHNAERERIELRQLAEEAAALAVSAVVGFGVFFEVELGLPIRRSVGDGIDFVQDVFPVLLHVARAGEHAGHADDGEVGGVVTGFHEGEVLLSRDWAGGVQLLAGERR